MGSPAEGLIKKNLLIGKTREVLGKTHKSILSCITIILTFGGGGWGFPDMTFSNFLLCQNIENDYLSEIVP